MLSLTDGLKKKNHHVFFDNFFTSPKLLEDMEKDGIYGCGVVRRDRKGLPPGLKKQGVKKRYYCACVCMLLRVCVCVCVCGVCVCGVCVSVCGVCVCVCVCVCVVCVCVCGVCVCVWCVCVWCVCVWCVCA